MSALFNLLTLPLLSIRYIFFVVNKKIIHPVVSAPTAVAEYQLETELKTHDPHRTYAVGIYQKHQQLFFIKTWQGILKDSAYFSLLKEAKASRLFSSLLQKYHFSQLKTPQLIETITNANSYSLVYEYVQGNMLSTQPMAEQVEAFTDIYTALQTMSESDQNLVGFPRQSKIWYLLTTPIVTLVLTLTHPQKAKLFVRRGWDCWTHFLSLSVTHLELAHRDLEPGNVMVNGKTMYICDCENMIATLPGYDQAFLLVMPEAKDLSAKLFSAQRQASFALLRNYLSLLHSIFSDNPLVINDVILENFSQ